MKIKNVLIGFLMVLALAFSLVLAGCDSGGGSGAADGTGGNTSGTGDPVTSTATYSGSYDGSSYTLVVSTASGKAVAVGDSYILIIKPSGNERVSIGKVVEILSNGFTLKPSYGNAPVFTAMINGSSINGITGIITFTDETKMQGPGTFVSDSGYDSNSYLRIIGIIDGDVAEAIISKSRKAAYTMATGDYYVIRFVDGGEEISRGLIEWNEPTIKFIPYDSGTLFYGSYSGGNLKITGIPYGGKEWNMGDSYIISMPLAMIVL